MNNGTGRLTTEPVQGRHGLSAVPMMIPGTWFVGILTLSLTLVAGLMLANGLTIQATNRAFVTLASVMTLLAAIRYSLRTAQTTFAIWLKDFSEYCLLFMAISLLGVIASYPVAAVSSGFSDPALASVDELLRFNWIRWYAFVVQYPVLQHLGALAYSTIYISPAILLAYMAWQRQRAAARQFLLTFWLAAVITLLLFPLFPANGPLVALWNGPIPYMPTSALYQSEIIPALRDHSFTQVDLGSLRGLVCAPSFHTVCATLYIAAAWPIARLRWPLLGINGAMLLATPVEGNHYLSDMFLGLAVALVAIALVRRAMRTLARNPSDHTSLGASIRPAAIKASGALVKAP